MRTGRADVSSHSDGRQSGDKGIRGWLKGAISWVIPRKFWITPGASGG